MLLDKQVSVGNILHTSAPNNCGHSGFSQSIMQVEKDSAAETSLLGELLDVHSQLGLL